MLFRSALRRNLLAADVLGLVLARYVLRIEPLAAAPRELIISAFAPALTDHLRERRSAPHSESPGARAARTRTR